ncbi:MAG: hypothetical protein ACR2QM_05605 [Longimicrobiales bacterium]
MRKALLLASIALLTGCQTYQVDRRVDESAVRLAELRARATQSSTLMKRVDQPEWSRGHNLELGTDSLRWLDELGQSITLHQSAVEAVRFERRRAAAVTFSVIGVSAGALVGLSVGDDREWWEVPEMYLGAGIGGLMGVTLGLVYGLPVTYRFH